MSLRVLRQDPAWGSLIFGLPISIFYAMVVRSALLDGEGRGLFIFFVMIYFLVSSWVTIASNISNRCSRLNLTLPLSTRRLWLLRIVSLLSVGVLTFAGFAITLLWNLDPPAGNLSYGIMADVLFKTAAVQLLIPFLLQTPRLELFKISGDSWYIAYTTLVVFALALIVAMVPVGAELLILTVPLALILALRIILRLPASLSVSPREPEEGVAATATVSPLPEPVSEEIPSSMNLHWTAFRILFNHWIGWMGFMSMALFAMTWVLSYYDSRSLTMQNAVIGLWLWALLSNGIARLYKMDAWPVSRRMLLVWTLLPGLLAASIGGGFTAILLSFDKERSTMVEYVQHELKVPAEFRELAWNGEVPLQTAPWGESHHPWPHRLLPGLDAAVYNPYEVSETQSLDFRAWQTDRAVERVHGEAALRPDRANLDEEFRAALERGSFTVAGSAGRGSALRSRTLALAVAFGLVLLTLVLSLGMSIYRGYSAQKVWLVPGFVGALGGLIVLVLIADQLGWLSATAIDSLPSILFRRAAESLAAPTWLYWLFTGLVALAGYLIVERQFLRIEVSFAHKPKPAIQEW